MKSKTRKGTSWRYFGKAEGSTNRKPCPSYQWLEPLTACLSISWSCPQSQLARANHLSLFLPHRLCAGLDMAFSTHQMAICMVLCKEHCTVLGLPLASMDPWITLLPLDSADCCQANPHLSHSACFTPPQGGLDFT